MKRRLYFVRHGESEQNIGGITGEESPLTERGIEQSKFIAHRAAKLPIEVIITSTAQRASDTAKFIAEVTGKPIVESSDLLVERRHPSSTIGLRMDNPEQIRIEKLINDHFGEENYRVADEETWVELKARALKALEMLDARPERELMVVTHAMFLRMLTAVMIFGPQLTSRECNLLIKHLRTSHTGLTIFEKSDEDTFCKEWRVLTWNDHAHLG